jgi:hypothetical protein
MSSTEKDRKVQSGAGRSFRSDSSRGPPLGPSFAETIAIALHKEFGGTAAAVKSVVRLTGANERAVKNWFAAKNGPSGENLTRLMGRSDEVLEAVLHLAGRQELIAARRLAGAREKLKEMLAMIDDLEGRGDAH